MAHYEPLRKGDLVSLYKSVMGAPLAFSEPPLTIDEQYGKQVDVSDGMGKLWIVLEWVLPKSKHKDPSFPSRMGAYVKIMSGKSVCWVMEYYLNLERRAKLIDEDKKGVTKDKRHLDLQDMLDMYDPNRHD